MTGLQVFTKNSAATLTVTMAERFFNKVANDVLEASDQITNMLESVYTSFYGETQEGDGNNDEQVGAESFIPSDITEEDIEELRKSPLEGMTESVMGDIMANQARPDTPMEHWNAFRHAIRWTEPFILSLIAFQVIMFLLCLKVSRRDVGIAPRITVMIFIGILVRSSEFLNNLASENWEKFCTQNYFDHRGVFVSIMFCSPLLVDSAIMLISYLREASSLLVQVKSNEIKKKMQKQKGANGEKKTNKTRRSKKEN